MTENASIGVLGSEFLQQLVKSMLLCFGTSVGGMAVFIESSLIDDAKGTIVVVTGVNALDVLGQQRNDVAIATDIVVVAALAIFGFATGYQVFYAERVVALVGHAVDDQQFHCVVMEGLKFLIHHFFV